MRQVRHREQRSGVKGFQAFAVDALGLTLVHEDASTFSYLHACRVAPSVRSDAPLGAQMMSLVGAPVRGRGRMRGHPACVVMRPRVGRVKVVAESPPVELLEEVERPRRLLDALRSTTTASARMTSGRINH